MEFGHWVLPENVQSIPEGSIGFVYVITNKLTSKKYIGKKLLENKKKRKPLKGRVNARRYKVESDWKTYTGSSPNLNSDVVKQGKDNFLFDILSFHPSKLLLAYWETKTIVDRNALFSDEYYNEVLNLRIRARKVIIS
jgi:hypothetical protein